MRRVATDTLKAATSADSAQELATSATLAKPPRRPAKPLAWRLAMAGLRIVILSYIGLVTLLYSFQSRLVYAPTHQIEATPAELSLSYEDVTFVAADGVRLRGWFVPAERARGVLLFCHGNGGNISHRLASLAIFHRLGLSVFIFDYRGYGQSQGKPTEHGTYLDAEAAWDHLVGTRRIRAGDIIIFGESLGGAIAAHLAKDHTSAALILQSAPSSAADLGQEMFWFFPVRWVIQFKYSTVDYVRSVKCPTLVIHSPQDEMVPVHHGRRIFDAAPPPKEFLEITGSHNAGFLESGRAYEEGIAAFLQGLKQSGAPPAP